MSAEKANQDRVIFYTIKLKKKKKRKKRTRNARWSRAALLEHPMIHVGFINTIWKNYVMSCDVVTQIWFYFNVLVMKIQFTMLKSTQQLSLAVCLKPQHSYFQCFAVCWKFAGHNSLWTLVIIPDLLVQEILLSATLQYQPH